MAHLITAHKGQDHVTSRNASQFNAGTLGPESYLLPVGNKLACTMINSNTLRVLNGMAQCCGYCWEVPGDYEEVNIDNGYPGLNRIDLVVAHIEIKPVELCELRVLKGEAVAGAPVEPEYIEGDLNNGAIVAEQPIASVELEGINVKEPVSKLVESHTIEGVYKDLSKQISDLRDSVSQQITGKWVARPGEISLVDWSLTTKGAQPYIQISVFTPDGKRYIGTLNMSAFS